MLPYQEQFLQDPGRSLRCLGGHRATLPLQYHQHAAYELTLVEGRGLRRLVADREDRCDGPDLVLLGPHLPHSWVGDDAAGYDCVVLQFGVDFLGRSAASLPEAGPIKALLERAAGGLHLPVDEALLCRCRELPALAPMAQVLALLGLLDDLAGRPGLREIVARRRPCGGDPRLSAVCDWLQRHCHRPVDLAHLAARHELRPPAFSQWFRRRSGCSLSDYLQQLRIGRACELLLGGREPIAEIARLCGFRNLSNFNRAFRRRCGCTPRQYRQRGRMS